MMITDKKIPFYKDYFWWWFSSTKSLLYFLCALTCAFLFLFGYAIFETSRLTLTSFELYVVVCLAMTFLVATLYIVLTRDDFWTYYILMLLWGVFGAVRFPELFGWAPRVLGYVLGVWVDLGVIVGLILVARGLLTDKWRSNLW